MDEENLICNYFELLEKQTGTVPVASDEDLQSLEAGYLVQHNQQYTDLLNCYVENAKKSLDDKRKWKSIFFYGSIVTMGTLLIMLFVALITAIDKDNTIQIVTKLIAATVSFASVFIVLPKIIAEYLFNTSDEKNMVDIIKNMQEYDKSLRENIKK